jgi:hypothetical protein
MTTATSTNSPRVLTPTAEYFPHDGAAFVRLTPSKSLKNAAIIYESIKNLPDKTLIRGDFDKHTRPYIFFPKRPKKQIGQTNHLHPVEAKNIEAGRKEMINFLSSIVLESHVLQNTDSKVSQAALDLKNNVASTMDDRTDFKVGDIKKSLHVLANAYYLDEVRKKTSPHRLLGRQVTKIQNQRLRQFVAISKEKADEIYTAIRGNLKKYDVQPEMGLFAIKVMIKGFLDQDSVSSKSFASYVRQHADDPDIQFFAKSWLAISQPMPSDERIQFSTEPWAKELDRLCEIVVKSNRRSTRVMAADTVNDPVTAAKVVLHLSTSKQSIGIPKTVKPVYSSLKTEDTEDSTSFPSSPYQPKQSSSSSSASAGAARLYPSLASEQAPESLLVPVSPKLSDYFNEVSQQDDPDSALSAQSTLSPTNEKTIPMSMGARFRSQLSALSRSVLPSLESEDSLNQSEKTRLLNNAEETSNDLSESQPTEEKM